MSGMSPSSDELFRLVLESATDFAVFSTDPEGLITSWNSGAERLLGFREDDVVGRSTDVIFTPDDVRAGVPGQERESALRDGRAEDERWHMRQDGSRFWGSGLLMPLKGTSGFVKIMRDHTERHRSEQELKESEARFRVLATNIPQLAFRTRSTGERTWGSPQWEVFAGLSDRDSRGYGWLDAIHPDDREHTVSAWTDAVQQGLYDVEHRTRRAVDGEYRWHKTRARPVDQNDPTGSEWVGTATDIHDLRTLQDRQRVLLAELQHRTRNLLTIVGAIARDTARNSASLSEFEGEFESRLRALSRVQGLLAQNDHRSIDLREIISSELLAHMKRAEDAEVDGPDVSVPANMAQTLSLALHELATNAVKYGALSERGGHLSITWTIETHGGKSRLLLDWRERGVAMPDRQPTRVGFGSQLIKRALPYQLGAETKLQFMSDGVHCSIAVVLMTD
jgi:PAS domain S-box-containing protein